MKKSEKRELAVLLAALLALPTSVLPASAEEASMRTAMPPAAEVTCNPGAGYFTIYDWNSVSGNNAFYDWDSVSGNDALLAGSGLDASVEEDMEYFREYFCFDENGGYNIQVEPDAFFPYEVEFTVAGEKFTKWFDTPDSTVEVGGHVFSIDSEMTGEQITGMTLNVADKSVVLYPEKEFVNQPMSMVSTMSVLPLQEKKFAEVDLRGYTPIELTQVSISALVAGETMASEKVAWQYNAYIDEHSYEINGTIDKVDLSWGTSDGSATLQLIDNNGDQLDGNATRYSLPLRFTDSNGWKSVWLKPVVYKKAADGRIIDLSTLGAGYSDPVSYKWNGYDRRFYFYLDSDDVNSSEQVYVKLSVNDAVFPNVNFATLKAFEGEGKNTEITDQLITAGTEGYAISLSQDYQIILEAYDADGRMVGSLPMSFDVSLRNASGLELGYLHNGLQNISASWSISGNVAEVRLSDRRADATYYWAPYYRKNGVTDNSYITAAYVGTYASIAEANAADAENIKNTLFGGGYSANYSGDGVSFTIFVGADGEEGQKVYQYTIKVSDVTGLELGRLYDASGNGRTYEGSISGNVVKMNLYSGYAADATYYWRPKYIKNNVVDNSCVTAAYVGTFASIAEASAAGENDIKDTLFGTHGYGANYSGAGVEFTIFVGADGEEGQKVEHYTIKAIGQQPQQPQQPSLGSGTNINIRGFYAEDGSAVHLSNMGDSVNDADDSYGDNNYFTFYADKEVNLAKLKMSFSLSSGAKAYVGGTDAGQTELKSNETILDFSNGPIQITVASEDGKNQRNVWVAVYKPAEGTSQLYINSLGDASAKTEEKDGIIYSTREVMMDSIHGNIHDIMVANLGTLPIANLKTELSADATVALDGYWQLNGQNSLEGFSDSYGYLKNEDGSFSSETSTNGKLWNLAKVRLVKKAGVEDGTDVTGTLTFKSGETTLMVLNLTGTVGDPTITTKEIPAAVKYVPYGVMIQNSNKYSWNKVTYRLYGDGALPAGMTLKENGEIYGVPTETGEFTFTVCMKNNNSRSRFSNVYREFTLNVVENTDANVDGATDEGYTVLDRIPNLSLDAQGSYSIRSNGAFADFQDIYLDGVKLVEGTDYTKSEGSTRVTINSQTLMASKVTGAHTLGLEFREGATESSEGSLKRAAQNYYLEDRNAGKPGNENPGDSNNPGGNDKPGNGNDPGGNDIPGIGNNPGGNGNPGNGNNSGGNGNSGNSSNSEGNNNSGNSDNSDSSSNAGSVGNSGSTGSPASTAAKASQIETVTHIVQRGDTLWKIAAKYYGKGELWRKVYEDNKVTIRNPNILYLGQKLVIYISGTGKNTVETETTPTGAASVYKVRSGDSFWRIANQYYGDGKLWRKIFRANEALVADPKRLRVGQEIVIPE